MDSNAELAPIPTSVGELQFSQYDAGFGIGSGADACVGHAKVELFSELAMSEPGTSCRLYLSTTPGEPGEKRAPLFAAVLEASAECEAVPELVRGEYRLADTTGSYIDLLGNPDILDFGGLCLRAGVVAHIEGTFVRDTKPSGLSQVYPEFELPPIDIEIPGEVSGSRDASSCEQ